jgi:hypothetical protein
MMVQVFRLTAEAKRKATDGEEIKVEGHNHSWTFGAKVSKCHNGHLQAGSRKKSLSNRNQNLA